MSVPARSPTPALPRATRHWGWASPGVFLLLLLGGLALRETFSFWTGLPYDLEIWIRTGAAVGGGLDPYAALWPPIPGLSIAYFGRDLSGASYLPLWPLYTGAAYAGYSSFGGGDRFVYYFLLKQAPIAGDLLVGVLLYRLSTRTTGDRASGARVLALWLFLPFPFIISAVWGQFDSLAVALVVALLLTDAPVRSNLLYGLGIFVKWVTAIFLPFEVFRRRGTARLTVALGIALPLLLTALVVFPLGWGTAGLISTSSTGAGGIGGGMSWVRWVSPYGPLSFVDSAPGAVAALEYLWVPAVILVGWWAARRRDERRVLPDLDPMLAIVAAFLVTRWGLNEQYFLYLLAPFLLDVMVVHRERRQLFVLLLGLATVFLFVNQTLGVPFLAPLGPGYFNWVSAANNAPGWDPLRLWTMNALAIVITITLVQVVRVALSPTADPRPWVSPRYRLWSRPKGQAPPAVRS